MKLTYERGRELLRLLGEPVKRPKLVPALPPNNGICKHCDACVVWANAPSGKRLPLDFHPDGDLVLVDGTAVSFGPAHEGLRRFCLHFRSCRKGSSNKETAS